MTDNDPLTVFGDTVQSGVYILRIVVSRPLRLAFGQFKGGQRIVVPAGEMVYVGSALAERGATSLARRLIRHATRAGGRPPHPIRAVMLAYFPSIGLACGNLLLRTEKRLHWNVDYLLNQPAVTLTHVIAVRTQKRLEPALARLLADDPRTFIIEKGLGAADARGATHLLAVKEGDALWRSVQLTLPATFEG